MGRRLPWAAVWTIARERLHRRWIATIALVVLAGLSAALPMAVWSASRRASTAYDRFVAEADPPDSGLVICPPGLDRTTRVDPQVCFDHRATTELDVIQADPHVQSASRYGYRILDVGLGPDPEKLRFFEIGAVSLEDPGPKATLLGDPIVVSGRLPDPDATDEALVAEPSRERLGVTAGDRVWVRFTGADTELHRVTIVGVVRTPDNLLPLPEAAGDPAFHLGPRFLAPQRAAAPNQFGGVAVWLDDDDPDGLVERLGRQLDQLVVPQPLLSPDGAAAITQATDFESRAGATIAATAAIVALFFVGQATSRQARTEAADDPTLVTLGFTRRDILTASVIRWSPAAVGAAITAVMAAAAASTLGPLGVARRGIWERTVDVDAAVLATGAIGVMLLVLCAGCAGPVRRSRQAAPGTVATPASLGAGAPSVRTGLGLAWHGVRRGATLPLVSAVLASALAVAAVITATGGTSTLQLVTDEPRRFGAPWDALVSERTSDEDRALVAEVDGVDHAALVDGTNIAVGRDDSVWVQAFSPVEGVPVSEPVMVDGRAPAAEDEIAFGTQTLRQSGANVGDTVEVVPIADDQPLSFEVVGVAMVTDGAEPNVGQGALVTPAGADRIELGTLDDAVLAIGIADGADHGRTLSQLRQRFPTLIAPFPVPRSLDNAKRITGLPILLALGSAALASVTFAHALVVSVRRNRRELAICRVLGFSSRQVRSAVSVQATVLAVAAAAIGVPLGIIGARWGWRMLADAFGVVTEPRLPVIVALTCVLGLVAVANLAAAPAARAVARRRTAEVLRSE